MTGRECRHPPGLHPKALLPAGQGLTSLHGGLLGTAFLSLQKLLVFAASPPANSLHTCRSLSRAQELALLRNQLLCQVIFYKPTTFIGTYWCLPTPATSPGSRCYPTTLILPESGVFHAKHSQVLRALLSTAHAPASGARASLALPAHAR